MIVEIKVYLVRNESSIKKEEKSYAKDHFFLEKCFGRYKGDILSFGFLLWFSAPKLERFKIGVLFHLLKDSSFIFFSSSFIFLFINS